MGGIRKRISYVIKEKLSTFTTQNKHGDYLAIGNPFFNIKLWQIQLI
jgi:hypothetical protein